LEIFKIFVDGRTFSSWTSGDVAVLNGHLHVLQAKTNLSFTNNIIDFGVLQGNLKILDWLQENNFTGATHRSVDISAEKGSIETLEWLHSHNYLERTDSALCMAALYGHIHILEYLHKFSAEFNIYPADYEQPIEFAIEGGFLNVIEWLHSKIEGNYVCHHETVDTACFSSHLSIVEWLVFHAGGNFSDAAFHNAASQGHVHILKWLQQNKHLNIQGEWNLNPQNFALEQAAAQGHLDAVQWLYKNMGAKLSVCAVDKSIQMGHTKITEWFFSQAPSIGFTYAAVQMAIQNGHAKTINWLQSHKPDVFAFERVEDDLEFKRYNVI